MAKIKILVVGDPASIHASRFVSLLQEIGYEVRVFQSQHAYLQDEHLKNTIIYVSYFSARPENGNILKASYPIDINFNKFCYNFMRLLMKTRFKTHFINRSRKDDLIKVLLKWQPDIVFSLKMQNDGYTVSEAKDKLKDKFKPKWIHFNWGTDIEFFGKHHNYKAEHLPKIKKLLSLCDFHIADCKRDVRQAVEFGFRGVSLGECLAPGGFDLSYLFDIREEISRNGINKKRDVILIKGRQGGLVGKAFNVLAAMHKLPNLIRKYKIKIIMCGDDVQGAAAFLSQIDNINYEVIPRLKYRELLELFARSRIAISASDVDGTPSFLIEAMAMGALPIHSDMESIREWIDNCTNGLLFPVDDIPALTRCIKKALEDDNLIENARNINWRITNERMDREKTKAHIKNLIENTVLKNYVN